MRLFRQLALFKQTMQAEGLSKFQFVLRTMMLLLSICLMSFTFMSSSGSRGLLLLSFISYTNVAFVVVATINLFCSCITEEKEGDTLGLLLMTGLSPFGLILGKSLSRLYIVLQLFILQLPLVVLAITQGGVSQSQVLALVVFCLSLIVCLSQIGLLFSVLCSRTSSATLMTISTCVLFYILSFERSADPWTWWTAIFTTNYAAGIFGVPIIAMLLLGVVFFLISIICFSLKEYSVISQVAEIRSTRINHFRFGPRAISEKDFHFYVGGTKLFVAKFIFGFCLFVFLLFSKLESILPFCALLWLWSEGLFYSQTIFAWELKAGTMQPLGVLPMGLRKIVLQKMMVCLGSLLPAILFSVASFELYRNTEGGSWGFFFILYMVWISHILLSTLCSISFKKMTLVATLIAIILFSILYLFCPLLWLLFLPTIVLLAVHIMEKLQAELGA